MKFPLIVTTTILFHWHLPSLGKRVQDNKNVTFVQRCFSFLTAKREVSQCIINLAERVLSVLLLLSFCPDSRLRAGGDI